MAFKIPFVPPNKVSFPEDPLPAKFFNDESQGRRTRPWFVQVHSQKARFKGDTVTMKEIISNRCDEMGKKILKRQKYWKVSISLT